MFPSCCLSGLKKRRSPFEGGASTNSDLERTNVVGVWRRCSLRLRSAYGLQYGSILEYCRSYVCRCRPVLHDFDSLTVEFIEWCQRFHWVVLPQELCYEYFASIDYCLNLLCYAGCSWSQSHWGQHHSLYSYGSIHFLFQSLQYYYYSKHVSWAAAVRLLCLHFQDGLRIYYYTWAKHARYYRCLPMI